MDIFTMPSINFPLARMGLFMFSFRIDLLVLIAKIFVNIQFELALLVKKFIITVRIRLTVRVCTVQ